MAGFFIAANRGQTLKDVVVGTSTQSKDMELQITSGSTIGLTKQDVMLFIDILEQYIISNGLPDGQVGVDLPPL